MHKDQSEWGIQSKKRQGFTQSLIISNRTTALTLDGFTKQERKTKGK